jgi:hypothetical protein
MTTIIFGGGASFGGGVQSNSPGSPTIQATAGSVTTVTGTINQPINNVSTFSSVQYGISPYTYSISSGTLPTGVTLDSTTGIISGIPTATQSSSSVTVSVTDSLGVTASTTATVAFTVGSAIVATANSVAPVTGYTNQAISTVTPFSSVTGGTQPYWYFVSSGTLPDRVTLDPTTGQISGTPTQTYAKSNVTISVRDAGGIVASTTSTISFTVILVLVAMPGGTSTVFGYQSTAITSFSAFTSVSGGTAPYTYYVSSGTLPTGIAINSSTGLVSGTPTATQSSSNVTFSVKDANNLVASTTVTVSFTVNSAITAMPGGTSTVFGYQSTAITSFSAFTSVSGGYTPYVYSVSSGTLPTGVAINSSTGQVSGTPTATYATASVTFTVTDAQGYIAATTTTVSFTVNAAITATAGATTTVSQQQNTAIASFNPFGSVSGGYTPYTYYISSGTLPTGITQNTSTGLVSGTPTVVQSAANVVFSVKDSANSVATTTSTVNFTVTPPPPYTVNYLVVGGGGGGGSGSTLSGGGGGGAGQFLCGSTNLSVGVTYTITTATNAAGARFCQTLGANGGSSSLSGAPIGTITATGGGGGASFNTFAASPGASGGGGSGGWFKNCNGHPLGPNAGSTGSPGNPGGTGGLGNPFYTPGSPTFYQGTGGGAGGGGSGGAGSPGGNSVQPNPTTSNGGAGGTGGLGKTWSYTGPTVFYAGGGGGGAGYSQNIMGAQGAGGSGVGGQGGTTNFPGLPGSYGSGGGGGGRSPNYPAPGGSCGGYGGVGVVILAVPTPQYPGAYAPIATTPPSAPGQTVLRWTTPGTYVA